MKHVYLFDIDGTLYNNKFHEIDSHLTEEFQYLVDQGDLIYLVSSRSPYEMAHLPAEFIRFPFSGMILEGGAAIYDENKQLVDARLIRNSDVKTIRNFCRENHLLWRYSGPDGNFFNSEAPKEVRHHWRKLYMVTPKTKEWVGDDVCNIIIWTDDSQTRDAIAALLPDSSKVFYSKCVEIRAPGISKESTLEKLSRHHEPCMTIAVGDGLNDVKMIKAAGYGVAVGNAKKAAKEAADEVIGSVQEEGVSSWLKKRRLKRAGTGL
ncbi:MAG: HAD hydrolase family protein [Allobaculum sp.]|uniref:HAD hydrolase family protein n=2 Tax=Allobaculum TaxID=174708 RepID=UPI003999C936